MTRRSLLTAVPLLSSLPLVGKKTVGEERNPSRSRRVTAVIDSYPSRWKDVLGNPCEIRVVRSVTYNEDGHLIPESEKIAREAWTYPSKSVPRSHLIGCLDTARYIMSEEKGIVDIQSPIGEALGETASYVCGIGRGTHGEGWWSWSFDDPMNFGGTCGFFGVGQVVNERTAWYWRDYPYQFMETDEQAKVNASYDSISSSLYRWRSRVRD